MKLDRNINPDGRGKYALINLRKIDEMPSRLNQECVLNAIRTLVEYGVLDLEGRVPFFIIKYKDMFAAPALRAYASAVRGEVDRVVSGATLMQRGASEAHAEREDLLEFALEIEREAELAESWPTKQIPN